MYTASAPRQALAFTIIEALVVLGVVMVLAAVLTPSLVTGRAQARAANSLSNIRQAGILVAQYADENRDMPPVLFRPELATFPDGPWQDVVIDGVTVRGAWFNNADFFHALLARESVQGIMQEPTRTAVARAPYRRSQLGDYSIAHCFYASPEYWNRWTQTGVAQFRAQHVADVLFPSSKGFMKQSIVYTVPEWPEGFGACCLYKVRAAVLWADNSATMEVQASLLPGEPNFYFHGNIVPPPIWSNGSPIDSTKDGVRGRDR